MDSIEVYDKMILNEIKKLMDEVSESYEYVDRPTSGTISRMRASPKELEKHVKGKLEDLLKFIEDGKFW